MSRRRDIYPSRFIPSPCHRFIKLVEDMGKVSVSIINVVYELCLISSNSFCASVLSHATQLFTF